MTFESIPWGVSEAEHDNHLLFVRFRRIPKTFPKSSYPRRLNIFWKMSEADQNGLPTEEEFDRLATFEDRLVLAVEKDDHSILAGALTCDGEKEFIFHTADVKEFMARLRNMPQEEERYPITIQQHDDPHWSYVGSVIPNDI